MVSYFKRILKVNLLKNIDQFFEHIIYISSPLNWYEVAYLTSSLRQIIDYIIFLIEILNLK